jgi:hypothetical protein
VSLRASLLSLSVLLVLESIATQKSSSNKSLRDTSPPFDSCSDILRSSANISSCGKPRHRRHVADNANKSKTVDRRYFATAVTASQKVQGEGGRGGSGQWAQQ